MNEDMTPAGLGGKLYFCRAEDFERQGMDAPMTEVKTSLEGHCIDLREHPMQEQEGDGEGWTVTATGRIDLDGNKRAMSELRRMLLGEGRLPRKEKKRRINRVVRDWRIVAGIAALMYNNSHQMMDALASLMFPEMIRLTTDKRSFVIIPTPAQIRCVRLCMQRIPKQAVRVFRKHHSELTVDELNNF